LYIALLHIVFSAGGRGTTLGTIIFFAIFCMFCELFACFAGRNEVFTRNRFANSFSNSLVKHFLFGQTL
jgi:hypothetical protein